MIPHGLALAVEGVTTALAIAGMGYYFAADLAAIVYMRQRSSTRLSSFAPPVSLLKSLKGLDPGMLDAFRSHCRQDYAGDYELLFGVSSLDDAAAAAVVELQHEYPERTIRLIECPERLGANGKVSTLTQLIPHAQHPYLLINDSDISVSPRYLDRVMANFAPEESSRAGLRTVGLVTALYRARPHGTLPSKLEALGISTDFIPGVLLANWIAGGMNFGLGSTLAVSREALAAIGGLETLVDYLADDYELGTRIHAAGYRVALSAEVVETSVPAYGWREFFDHQVRWYRTVRDARPASYAGMVFMAGFAWALLNVVASGLSAVSLWLLGMSSFLRLAMAMAVAAGVLGDHQTLPRLLLLPLRDVIAMGLWVAGFSGHEIVWRGERFVVNKGKLTS